jgi:hypothetical protein
MAVQEFIKKRENQNLRSQINNAFSDLADSEEIEVHEKMREKQRKNLEKEPW